jgi:hypothetical protein
MINSESDIQVSRLEGVATHALDHFRLRTGGNANVLGSLKVEQVNEPNQLAVGIGDRKCWYAQRAHLLAHLRERIFWAARGRVWSHRGADLALIWSLIWALAVGDAYPDEVKG